MNNELLKDLRQRKRSQQFWTMLNFVVAQTSYWLAIAASFGSAIAVAFNSLNPLILACLAAIPGAVILIDSTFHYADRASWHSLYANRLDGLIRRLKYEGETSHAISQKLTELVDDMENKQPKLEGGAIKPSGSKD